MHIIEMYAAHRTQFKQKFIVDYLNRQQMMLLYVESFRLTIIIDRC
jgi:hypothetical protein